MSRRKDPSQTGDGARFGIPWESGHGKVTPCRAWFTDYDEALAHAVTLADANGGQFVEVWDLVEGELREATAGTVRERQTGHALDWTGLADPVAKEAARRHAYRSLFDTSLGRLVLLDILIDAQLFGVRGAPTGIPGMTDYDAGLRDRVVMIADLAGVEPRHMAEALMTGNEGYIYARPDEIPEH